MAIDQEALKRFCEDLIRKDPQLPPWEAKYHFYDGGIETVSYFLVLDSVNFCFWPLPGSPKWEVVVESERLSGYYALAACLKKAFVSGLPIGNADYLTSLTTERLKQVLNGTGELQLMEQRVHILHELGQVLRSEYQGKAHRLVEAASGSALQLANILSRELSSFRDEAFYRGRRIFFHKRSQILAADIYGAFGGKSWGAFSDMAQLTAFADYKLPQVLRHLGIFQYSDELARRIDGFRLIEAGSLEEVEIRANTVFAVELIRQELARSGGKWKAFEIDWILWNLGQADPFRERPYHRTVTIFY